MTFSGGNTGFLFCLGAGSGGANHLGGASSGGGPSPAGGASDNVSVSNPFDDVSPSPPPQRGGGPFPSGPHPPYPANTPPRPQGQGYNGQGGYGQYPGSGPAAPPEQYSPYPAGSGYPAAARPVYPPYSSESGAAVASPSNTQGGPPFGQDPYTNRYNMNAGSAGGYNPRPTYGGTAGNAGPAASQPPGGPYTSPQDYYRTEQVGETFAVLLFFFFLGGGSYWGLSVSHKCCLSLFTFVTLHSVVVASILVPTQRALIGNAC